MLLTDHGQQTTECIMKVLLTFLFFRGKPTKMANFIEFPLKKKCSCRESNRTHFTTTLQILAFSPYKIFKTNDVGPRGCEKQRS